MNTKRQTKRGGSKKPKKSQDKNSKTKKKNSSKSSQKKTTQKKTTQKKPTLAAMNSFHDDLMQVINARIDQPEQAAAASPTDSKPVILLVHAEWCGHCQALMPAWDEMEKQVHDDNYLNDKVIIRKIESSELPLAIDNINNELNDDGKVVVRGYPTMGNIDNKNFMPYGGNRDADSLMNWVKRVAK